MSTKLAAATIGERLVAPQESEFSRWPASWYRLCGSRQIDRGPYSRAVFQRQLVAYRRGDGSPVVMDAVCSHLGADLSHGKVVGDCIECPFHGWRYGSEGRCEYVPAADQPPGFARQQVFPAQERHGSVYFFNGPTPTFPLPFFFHESPEDYRAIAPRGFTAGCTWYMVNAHAFDVQHFATVHGRRLLEPIEVDCPASMARRSSYRAEVLGERYYDHILRRFVGREVGITLTIWGGTFAVVTGDFGKRRSRFFVISEPLVDGRSRCEVIVFSPRLGNRALGMLIEPLTLHVRRHLTTAYLRHENEDLGHPRYNQGSLTEIDREMIEYFRWAAALD